MRILDKSKVAYKAYAYEAEEFIDGLHSADAIGAPHEQSFKTLLAQGKSKEYYVFVIPIEKYLRILENSRFSAFFYWILLTTIFYDDIVIANLKQFR